jgi:hypothetical protein
VVPILASCPAAWDPFQTHGFSTAALFKSCSASKKSVICLCKCVEGMNGKALHMERAKADGSCSHRCSELETNYGNEYVSSSRSIALGLLLLLGAGLRSWAENPR